MPPDVRVVQSAVDWWSVSSAVNKCSRYKMPIFPSRQSLPFLGCAVISTRTLSPSGRCKLLGPHLFREPVGFLPVHSIPQILPCRLRSLLRLRRHLLAMNPSSRTRISSRCTSHRWMPPPLPRPVSSPCSVRSQRICRVANGFVFRCRPIRHRTFHTFHCSTVCPYRS